MKLIHKNFQIDDEDLPSQRNAVKRVTKKMTYTRNLMICLAAFDILYLVISFLVIGVPNFFYGQSTDVITIMMPYL